MQTIRKHYDGFTLIELLVVISIIALLISILLPALRQAREQAKSTVCKSRLHQCLLGFNTYAADYNDFVFSTGGDINGVPYRWPVMLARLGYLGAGSDSAAGPSGVAVGDASKAALCSSWAPESINMNATIGGVVQQIGDGFAAYGRNNLKPDSQTALGYSVPLVSAAGIYLAWDINTLIRPSEYVVFGDTVHWFVAGAFGWDMQAYDIDPFQNAWHFRHPGGAGNFAWGDGSVSDMRIDGATPRLAVMGYLPTQLFGLDYVPTIPVQWQFP